MPKNQTKASTSVPAQESRSPVSFDVRVYPVKDSKYTLANANVDINGVFAIRGVKVIRGEKGPFVAMPQYKDSHGDYHDICFPCTKEARQQFNDAVLNAYEQSTPPSRSSSPWCWALCCWRASTLCLAMWSCPP